VSGLDDAVKKLLRGCELRDIVVREFSARLRLDSEEIPEGIEDDEALSDLGMGYAVSEDHVDYRFTLHARTKTAEATAEVVARYGMTVSDLTEEVAVHFANRVAFFAAYPYLREIIHTSTNRLPGNQALVLPILQDPPGFVRAE
jgi:hypothetical protein